MLKLLETSRETRQALKIKREQTGDGGVCDRAHVWVCIGLKMFEHLGPAARVDPDCGGDETTCLPLGSYSEQRFEASRREDTASLAPRGRFYRSGWS